MKPRKQPSRILVAVDGSDSSMNAADYAITLAKNNNNSNNNNGKETTQVFAINVIDLAPIFKMLPSDTRKQLIRIGRQQASPIFDIVEEMAKSHDGDAKFKINTEMVETTSASAADEIIKYAKEKDVDLVVVGTKGRNEKGFTGKRCVQGSGLFSVLSACCSIIAEYVYSREYNLLLVEENRFFKF